MSEDDCGATFALPVAEDMEVVPVTIDVTDDAMNAMEGAMANAEDGDVLVVSVLGGGCSGFMYEFDFIEPPKNESMYVISEHDGLKIYCGKKSIIFLT